MSHPLLLVRRSRVCALLLLVALLAPAAWMHAICADEWAYATSPSDNPETPGPDLYSYKRLDDGAWTNAKRLAIQALSIASALEQPAETIRLALQESHLRDRAARRSSSCRGPPFSFAS